HGKLLDALDKLTTARGTAIGMAILASIDAIAERNQAVAPSGVDLSEGTPPPTTAAGDPGSGAAAASAAPPAGGYQPDTIVVLAATVLAAAAIGLSLWWNRYP